MVADDPAPAVVFGLLDDVIGFRMQRLRAALAVRMLAAMKSWGLRRGAFMVLALVRENPGLPQSALTRELGINKAQLVALLDELQERDLIERRISASDRRHNRLYLKPAGETLVTAMAEAVARIEAPVREALAPEALAQFKRAFDDALAAVIADAPQG